MDVDQSGGQFTTANTTSGEGMSQVNSLVTAPNPQMPPHKGFGQPSRDERVQLVRQYQHRVLNDWIPRKLSPNEIEEHRLLTQNCIVTIRRLEDIQASSAMVVNELEQKLFWARVSFRTFLGRTFRINDLPTEILTEIFRLVAWSIASPLKSIVARTRLVSVCRHWRIVAIQDSILWNAIWFLPYYYNTAFLWLERAKDAALDIRINDSEKEPLTRELAIKTIDLLFRKVSSIRVLIVMVREWEPALLFHQRLQEVAKRNIPMCLERLQIHRTGLTILEPGPGFSPELLTPVPLFGGAQVPSLRSLTIDGIHVDWEKSVLTNLANFDIRRQPMNKSPSLKYFREVVSSPELSSLVIISCGPRWPTSPQEFLHLEPVKLLKLRSLVLGGYSLHYGTYATRTFSAPNVVDITLTSIFGTDDEYTHYFKNLGSMPSILSLTLYNTGPLSSNIQCAAFFRWLKSVPRLTYLRLVNAHQSHLNVFLYDTDGRFNPTETKSLICPKLLYMELILIPDPDSIVRVVDRRNKLGFPLRKIYIQQEAAEKLVKEKPTVIPTLQSILGREKVVPLQTGERAREFDSLNSIR